MELDLCFCWAFAHNFSPVSYVGNYVASLMDAKKTCQNDQMMMAEFDAAGVFV